MNKPYKDWTKEEIVSYHTKICPSLKPYVANVKWEPSGSGWLPNYYKAPKDILEELAKSHRNSNL